MADAVALSYKRIGLSTMHVSRTPNELFGARALAEFRRHRGTPGR